MSIINLKAKCEDAKIMKDRTTELKSNITTVSDRLNNLTKLVESMKTDQNETLVKLDNKAEAFLLDVLATEVETQKTMLNELKEIMVTKDEFTANLDEISKCFESYILNTPRIKSADEENLSKRIAELELSLAELHKQNAEHEAKAAVHLDTSLQPANNVSSRSVPEVPELPVNKITVFKVPQKRANKTA
jgi:hypothetical protein